VPDLERPRAQPMLFVNSEICPSIPDS
jgi:hypothetical protein